MGSIVDGTVVLLYKRHQVVKEILAEKIELHRIAVTLPHQTGRITVRKHDNHLLGSTLSNEIIQDEVHLTHLEIDFFCIGGTADKIHYRVFLLWVFIIRRWCIDNGIAEHTHRIRPVVHIVHLTVRHILQRMDKITVATHIQQTVLEAFIGKPFCILRIHHLMAIHNKTIGVDVGNGRTKCNGPDVIFTFLHVFTPGKLYIYLNSLSVSVTIIESDGVVRMNDW